MALQIASQMIEDQAIRLVWDDFTCMYVTLLHDHSRWPKKLFYGPKGELKHEYSRCMKPNLNKKNARYQCKATGHISALKN